MTNTDKINYEKEFKNWIKLFRNSWTKRPQLDLANKEMFEFDLYSIICNRIKHKLTTKHPIPNEIINEFEKEPLMEYILSSFNTKFDIDIKSFGSYSLKLYMVLLVMLSNGNIKYIDVLLHGIVGSIFHWKCNLYKISHVSSKSSKGKFIPTKTMYDSIFKDASSNIKLTDKITHVIPIVNNQFITDNNFYVLLNKQKIEIDEMEINLFDIPYQQLLGLH